MRIFAVIALCMLVLTPLNSYASEEKEKHPLYKKALAALVEENKEKALEFLRKASNEGDVESQFLLAMTLLDKKKSDEDNEEGLEWLTTAAKNGDFRAQQMLDLREKYK